MIDLFWVQDELLVTIFYLSSVLHNMMFDDDDNDEGLTIMLLMKYLSFAGGDDAGEEQFTSSISPTLKMMDYMD